MAGVPVEQFPIRTVSTLTGVNPITLRAWERRYGLIQPTRTDSGHRVYSRADVDTIHRIVALMQKGVAIGQMGSALGEAQVPGRERVARGPWPAWLEGMIAAVSQFDEVRLEDLYNEALAIHPEAEVTRRLLLPLLRDLGERWATERGSVAEEHFFAMFLRNKLGARFHHRRRDAQGPRLIAACLPGENHEIGLLLFALAAHEHGFRCTMLGADMPIKELPEVVRRVRADGIVLSGSMAPERALLEEELPALVEAVRVPVFVGGLLCATRHDAIALAGAHPVGTRPEPALERMQAILDISKHRRRERA
jgi:DNA-binding transcriptional MerR regulator